MNFKFNEDKAIAIFLYVVKKLHDSDIKAGLHKIFKIMYFADQKHLVKYGRPVLVGDSYVAMKDGPVPSRIYDMAKIVRGDSLQCSCNKKYTSLFKIHKFYVTALVEPDIDELAISDIECLEESLSENKLLDYSVLREKSHDSAYESASRDSGILLRNIAKAAGSTTEMLKYLHSKLEAESCLA